MSIKEKIKSLADSYLQEIINVRRHLHQIPELGFEEFETSKFIASKLKEYGIPYNEGIAKTGIVGIIEGKDPDKKVIALRADMDALPIKETNDIPYKSKNEGVMHACGHDVHIACVLGAAKILSELKNEFSGTIKLFFQPSEEKFPGGAIAMINEKALENPTVQEAFAQHVLPTLDAGKVGMKQGKYMASTDEIYIKVKGKGGHAATPELNVNPIPISAHILIELEKHFTENKPPDYPSVLAFGKISGEGKTNIIPDEVNIEGTLRTYNEQWRNDVHDFIVSVASSIAASMGGVAEINIAKGYPFLVNDEKLTGKVKQIAVDYLGKENVIDLEMRMTAEDFAYFSQKIPSCYYRLGIRNEEKGITSNLHTSTFNVDESSLNTGMGLMAWIAFNELE
ncbi:MAG: amidohydrolase [Bacteroidetes bacterium]|nr:amidohydrolase [Bacteroidota bacterium]